MDEILVSLKDMGFSELSKHFALLLICEPLKLSK
jgi:hypothetical protein